MSKEEEKFSERFSEDNICILQKGIFQSSTEKRND